MPSDVPVSDPKLLPADRVDRTAKGPAPVGTTIFIGLRAADVLLQYTLLSRGYASSLITRLGGTAISPLAPPGSPGILGLQPYYAMVAAMALGSTVKQVLNMLFISEIGLSPLTALVIALFNTVFNSTNTLLSLWTYSSLAPSIASSSSSSSPSSAFASASSFTALLTSSPALTLGITLYTVGILTELISEVQRKVWKADPKNKGKAYGEGLFGLATNINYGGYTLWRAGYAMACAGLGFGTAVGAFFAYDFITRAIPALDMYCTQRYGQGWEDVKKRVHYRLLPWIY